MANPPQIPGPPPPPPPRVPRPGGDPHGALPPVPSTIGTAPPKTSSIPPGAVSGSDFDVVAELPQDGPELQIALLRAELDALQKDGADRTKQAAVQYEIAHLLEHALANETLAVKEYLSAYNLDPQFRVPLFALLRIFERRRSFKNLSRLHEAEARSGRTPAEKASALLDRGILLEDHLGQATEARALLVQALEADGGLTAASLSLERALFAAGDAAVAELVAKRADKTRDPVLRGMLLLETAWAREAAGDVDGAIEAARAAAALPAGKLRFLETFERLARKNERWVELVEALEARALLSIASAKGEDQGQGSGAFSVTRFADEARAVAEAAALWREAARVRLTRLNDAAGAVAGYAQAIALRPDDVLLRQERLLAAELAGDLDVATEDARGLLDKGIGGRHAAALHFRLAEIAIARQDADGARAALADALAADPRSSAAAAMIDDLEVDAERHAERLERFAARGAAEGADPKARLQALWRAAQIAADQLGDAPRAKALYEAATALASDRTPLVREAFGAATRLGDAVFQLETASQLLTLELDDEERSAVLYAKHALVRDVLGDATAADEVLRAALDHPLARVWAADIARLRGLEGGDRALLAAAHGALAELATDDDTAAAHHCGAARALGAAGLDDASEAELRKALARVPGHPYAVAVLEEILRARGDGDAVVALLREAAAAQGGARAAETALLLAGAAAEATGDAALAAQTYEEAADRDPDAVAPLWSMRRLAERTSNPTLLLRALEGLAQREADAGQPGRASLDVGEHYDLVAGKPELAEASLRAALDDEHVGGAAAAMLAVLPGLEPDARLAAIERMLRTSEESGAGALWRELGGIALAGDAARAEEAAGQVLAADPQDRWALYAKLRAASLDASRGADRAEAFSALSRATTDTAAAAELALHGLRARQIALGEAANDDAVIQAAELAAQAPGTLAAAVALDETISPGDDPQARAEAFGARLAHAEGAEAVAYAAAHGRALLAAGDAQPAVDSLRRAVTADPADLASWEALRVAAREVQSWDDVARACEALGAHVEGSLRADLLEEEAAVLMDHLERDADAEAKLREALAIDPQRVIAYGRLHDLLAEGGDAKKILALVAQRIDVVEEPADLGKLYYEQARLLRSLGDREGALAALDNLLMLEPEHVGGIALKVETSVSLERFSDAVDALRALASTDVPKSQKRVARLGAADFLEKKLGDAPGALAELEAIDAEGLGDVQLYVRMADLAERSGLFDDACSALERATNAAEGEARARHARRLGSIHARKRDDIAHAIDAYRFALSALPSDLDAAEQLAELVTNPVERREFLEDFEQAVRADLADDVTDEDALRKLRMCAVWSGDRDLEVAVLSVLDALDLALDDERDALEDAKRRPPRADTHQPLQNPLDIMRAPGDSGPLARVLATLSETVVDLEKLDPAAYGMGRGERVGPRDPNPTRDEIQSIARLFGLAPGDFYFGGREPTQIAAIPRPEDPPIWIAGGGVTAPLSPGRRFMVGRLAMAVRNGTVPFLNKAPGDIARLVFAAAQHAESPLPAGAGYPGVEELTRPIGKAMSRRVRKALPDLLKQLPEGGRTVEMQCRAVRKTAQRAGLAVSGDVAASLTLVLGGAPSREGVQASEDARDLVQFWISSSALALRRELGLVT